MNDIILIIGVLIGIDLAIINIKYFVKNRMKEETISWKLIGILQIPILIILYLLLLSPTIILIILFFSMIICTVLGFYYNYKGKISATEPIEAEIIDINSIPIHTGSCINYIYINSKI